MHLLLTFQPIPSNAELRKTLSKNDRIWGKNVVFSYHAIDFDFSKLEGHSSQREAGIFWDLIIAIRLSNH